MHQTPAQIFSRFLGFGFLAWSVPVAQINMIRQKLEDEQQWVTREEFNRALAVYQALLAIAGAGLLNLLFKLFA